MPLFVATYAYTADASTRDNLRPQHRAYLAGLPQLVLSGPTDDDGAVLVLEAEQASEVESILDDDPFAAAGLIAARRVVGWTVVLGRAKGRL